ncbi:MAG: TlpA disulfide reductase family protein [Phycisphaeraceae bacterium]
MKPILAVVTCLPILLASSVGTAHASPPPGDRLLDQVIRAYEQTDQYQSVQQFETRQVQGRWTNSRSAEVRLAFDRENDRLLIDRPDMYLVVRDGTLSMRSDEVPGRHLETAAPSPLTYEALVQLVPFLADPPAVELAFLLADDPVQALADDRSAEVETQAPADDDARRRPRLQMVAPPMSLTMTLDGDARLIDTAELQIDGAMVGMQPGESFSLHFDFEVLKHNEPIDDAAFDFDAPGSTAVATLDEMIGSGRGGAGGPGGGPHPSVGRDAPPIEIERMTGEAFKLEDVDADVIVLDFWATWCPPCWEGLRQLQGVHEWAEQEGLSVAIFAVNVQETVAEAQAYWQRENLTIPVLMDTEAAAAQAYGMQFLPHMVVIADDKVQHVNIGAPPGIGDQLKTQITELLDAEDE